MEQSCDHQTIDTHMIINWTMCTVDLSTNTLHSGSTQSWVVCLAFLVMSMLFRLHNKIFNIYICNVREIVVFSL